MVWIGLSYNVGIGARIRGQQFSTFFIMALCASPLIAAFVLFLRTPSNIVTELQSQKSFCPFCREDINPEALICKWCKRNLPEPQLRLIYSDLLSSDSSLLDEKNSKKLRDKAEEKSQTNIQESQDFFKNETQIIRKTSFFGTNSSLIIFTVTFLAFLIFFGVQLFRDGGPKEEWIYINLDFKSINQASPCQDLSKNYPDLYLSDGPVEENKVSIISENGDTLGAGYLSINGFSLLYDSSPKNMISDKSDSIRDQNWLPNRDETPYHVAIFEEKNSCRYRVNFPFAGDKLASTIQIGYRPPIKFNFAKPSKFFNDGLWEIEIPVLPTSN